MIDALGCLGQAMYDFHLCQNLSGINGTEVALQVPLGYQFEGDGFLVLRHSRHMEQQLGKARRIREYLKWLGAISGYAKEWRPDIIHWQFGFFSLFDMLLNRHLNSALPKTKVVITVHDTNPARPTLNNIIARRAFFKGADGIVVHSQEAAKDYPRWIKRSEQEQKIQVIPHGPYPSYDGSKYQTQEIRSAFGIPKEGPVLITIGSINENKGIVGSISIISELQKLQPSANYVIAGSAGNRPVNGILEARSKSFDPERIHVINRYLADEEIEMLHQIADFSLLIYKTSATSGAAIRSLCSGVPVICNQQPGFCAIVKDGANGLILEGISPEENAQKILAAFRDENRLRQMKERSLSTYEGLTWDQIALMHHRLYEEILTQHG